MEPRSLVVPHSLKALVHLTVPKRLPRALSFHDEAQVVPRGVHLYQEPTALPLQELGDPTTMSPKAQIPM